MIAGKQKRKPGRPKKAAMVKKTVGRPKIENARNHTIMVRVNDNEYEQMKYVCEKKHQSMSKALRGEIPKLYNRTVVECSRLLDGEDYWDFYEN